jgi:hypothetical protein
MGDADDLRLLDRCGILPLQAHIGTVQMDDAVLDVIVFSISNEKAAMVEREDRTPA